MIKLSEAAVAQVRASIESDGEPGLGLRIAAARNEQGVIDYQIGLDMPRLDDTRVEVSGVYVLIGPEDEELLAGATMDYVEIEQGEQRFIFLNPNDPSFVPPDNSR